MPTDGTRLHIIIVSGASVHRRFVGNFRQKMHLPKANSNMISSNYSSGISQVDW
jgi:hypothetical protein